MLALALLACTADRASTRGGEAPHNQGSNSLEAMDTSGITSGDGTGAESDTGKFEYGIVTNIRMRLPSTPFVASPGEWFTVEFALVDDAGELQDHWETMVPITLDCGGETLSIGGVDGIAGNPAVTLGGSLNPRDTTVMVLEPCESARLDGIMVAYQGTPPFHAYSDLFEVR